MNSNQSYLKRIALSERQLKSVEDSIIREEDFLKRKGEILSKTATIAKEMETTDEAIWGAGKRIEQTAIAIDNLAPHLAYTAENLANAVSATAIEVNNSFQSLKEGGDAFLRRAGDVVYEGNQFVSALTLLRNEEINLNHSALQSGVDLENGREEIEQKRRQNILLAARNNALERSLTLDQLGDRLRQLSRQKKLNPPVLVKENHQKPEAWYKRLFCWAKRHYIALIVWLVATTVFGYIGVKVFVVAVEKILDKT